MRGIRRGLAAEYRHGFSAELARRRTNRQGQEPHGPNATRAARRHGSNERRGVRGIKHAIDPVQLALCF